MFFYLLNVGRLACKLFEHMRREAAAVKIQKNLHCYFARKSYATLQCAAITLQTGLRAMTACNEFRFKKQTKAAVCIQVHLFFSIENFCSSLNRKDTVVSLF